MRVAQIPIKLVEVQANFLGDLLHLVIAQTGLICKQFMMKIPEFPLLIRSQGGQGSFFCEPVVWQRIMFDDQPYLLGIFLQHLLE